MPEANFCSCNASHLKNKRKSEYLFSFVDMLFCDSNSLTDQNPEKQVTLRTTTS